MEDGLPAQAGGEGSLPDLKPKSRRPRSIAITDGGADDAADELPWLEANAAEELRRPNANRCGSLSPASRRLTTAVGGDTVPVRSARPGAF